ncbi:FabA/FabZ family ACP-dehydratase [Actinoplanes sp. NPDC051861]|uniref:FabA/FabZ family ACP-dehydratase n=1 Tax=Actinoplanes sp. NPDC051861 TaxID=3155170 RepID=UPI003438588B
MKILASPLSLVTTTRGDDDGATVRLVTRLTVDPDDPHLRGHFPGLTVLPGVFVIDAMCQALAEHGNLLLREVSNVRFLAPLLAGDELTLDITAVPAGDGSWAVRAQGRRRDGTTTARIKAVFERAEDDDV